MDAVQDSPDIACRNQRRVARVRVKEDCFRNFTGAAEAVSTLLFADPTA